MKKGMLFTLAVIVAAVFSSCSDDYLGDLTVPETETMSSGTWKVTYYFDNGDGVSNDLDPYTFDMQDDGTLVITGNGQSFTGSWFIKSSDDDPAYDKEIEFIISGNKDMDDIDGSWLIAKLTETEMELLDDTPSEELHLARN